MGGVGGVAMQLTGIVNGLVMIIGDLTPLAGFMFAGQSLLSLREQHQRGVSLLSGSTSTPWMMICGVGVFGGGTDIFSSLHMPTAAAYGDMGGLHASGIFDSLQSAASSLSPSAIYSHFTGGGSAIACR